MNLYHQLMGNIAEDTSVGCGLYFNVLRSIESPGALLEQWAFAEVFLFAAIQASEG